MRQLGKRKGISLVEVVVAIAILGGALLAMGSFVVNFVRTVSTNNTKTQAVELAADRLEQVKAAPKYRQIDSLYEGTEATVAGFPGFTRKTEVLRVGGDSVSLVDYQVVTVTVTAPGLLTPVKKTTAIAAY